jgi:transcriptional antiterminator NusG
MVRSISKCVEDYGATTTRDAEFTKETQWFSLRTRRHHESIAGDGLLARGIESYVPMRPERRHWKHRIKTLMMPLFPGYIFARVPMSRFWEALTPRGVVELIGTRHGPSAVPENQIESIRQVLACGLHFEVYSWLIEGLSVRVKTGPMEGLVGVVDQRKNNDRFVLRVPVLGQSVSVDIDALHLEPLS